MNVNNLFHGEEKMIIRCRKCETSFRFDDQLMTGEGLWVRCSRCQDVFFQDNPYREEQTSRPAGPDDKTAVPSTGETASLSAPAPVTQPDSGETSSEQMSNTRLLSRMKGIQDAIEDVARPGSVGKEFDDLVIIESEGEPKERNASQKPAVAEVKKRKHPVLKFIAYLFLVVLVNIFVAGLYLGFFPEGRQRVADALSPYFPWAEDLIGQGQSGPVWGQVVIQDVRQHFVNNWLMGNLRVVEGSVVNKGKYALTRVQVRGRLYDNAGSIIGEWASFCGKILTDAELATLSESQLRQALTEPLVSNAASDRLNPNGQIPFMVVIAHHDQQAVGKTTVMVSGAEKLL
jgi:predicted Zn finger-like uncharacterized protein